ncbi:hypothetical protein ACOME3_001829 [Neoechinorhynchus agilis]
MIEEYVDTSSKANYCYLSTYEDKLLGNGSKSLGNSMDKYRDHQCNYSRFSILDTIDSDDIIIPHFVSKNEKFSFERLYRSIQIVLLDTCCREHFFLSDFCSIYINKMAKSSNVLAVKSDLFFKIFQRSLEYLLTRLKTTIRSSNDCIGLVLSVHITNEIMTTIAENKRRFSLLSSYYTSCINILIERFELAWNQFASSIGTSSTKSISNGMPMAETRKYAELVTALAVLNEKTPIPQVANALVQLQQTMKRKLEAISTTITSQREISAFMITNYDLCATIQSEHLSIKSQYTLKEGFLIILFIDLLIDSFFGGLASLFNEGPCGVNERSAFNDTVKATFQSESNTSWVRLIEQMVADIMRTFSNFKLGQTVSHEALRKLIEYYSKFITESSQETRFTHSDTKNVMPSLHELNLEIKKYKTIF